MSKLFSPHAYWVGPAHPFDLHEAYINFRRAFDLTDLTPIELTMTADSRYRVWVNETFVARGPERSFPRRQSVDLLDLTPYVKRGKNLIAVQVYSPGYSHFSYVHRGTNGLLAELRAGGTSIFVTDPTWRVKRDPSFAELVPRVSIYGSGVEIRDLRQDENWRAPDYDDAAWESPRVVGAQNAYPWLELAPRVTPLLVERAQPLLLLETRSGPNPEQSDPHLALRDGWKQAAPSAIPQDSTRWHSPHLTRAETAYWLFDLGRDYIGQGWAEIENARGGEQFAVSYQEKIRGGDLVISDPATYCRVRMTDVFALRAGKQTCETFSLRGGRYLLFALRGPASETLRIRFHARVSEYPLQVTKPFHSGDALLDEISSMCETTLRACLQDGFVDSTWRESSQWGGDALCEALTLSAVSDDVRPIRRVLEMQALGAYPDGILPSVLPGEVHAYAVLDYNWMWIELLAVYFRITGDNELVRELWQTLVKMLERFALDVNANGLIVSEPGRRLFLDWSPQSRLEPNAVYNLRYLRGLQAASELARQIRDAESAARWERCAEDISARVREAFWENGRWFDDVPRTTFSQLAASLALLTDAAPAGTAGALCDALVTRSLDDDDTPSPGKMVLASPFSHHYVFQALRKFGRDADVIAIVKSRWGRWVKQGYPTTWENWSVDFPDGSQCHAFSAHPRYHLAGILGRTSQETGA